MSDPKGGQGRQLCSSLRTRAWSEMQPLGGGAGHTSGTRPCLAFPHLLHAHHLTHLPFPGTICVHLPSLLLYWNLSGGSVAQLWKRKPAWGKMVASWAKLLTGSLFSDQLTKCCLLPVSLSFLPTVSSWSLAAGESNIYRKPPIYKRHGMVRGRQSLAKHGGLGGEGDNQYRWLCSGFQE